ncbi:MAG: PDZ domain-containing protein [Planctomycetota bacterium]
MKASSIRLLLWGILLPVAGFCAWQFVTFVALGGKEARTKVKSVNDIRTGLKSTQKPVEQMKRTIDSYEAFEKVNISGVPPKKDEPEGPASAPVVVGPKINPLDTVLGIRGTRVDPDSPQDSAAFVYWKDQQISKEDQKKTTLREGAWLPKPYEKKYRIQKIQIDRVTFLDDKDEVIELLIPKMKAAGILPGMVASRPAGATGGTDTTKNLVPSNYKKPELTRKITDNEYWLSDKDQAELNERGLEIIGRDVHASTYLNPKTKRPDGLRVTQIRPDSMPQKLGLRENDVVKEVNGVSIKSTADVYEYAKQHPNEKRVIVNVERFGRIISVSYVLPH